MTEQTEIPRRRLARVVAALDPGGVAVPLVVLALVLTVLRSPADDLAIDVALVATIGALVLWARQRERGALERSKRSEARAHAVFEQASDAIFLFGADGTILEANAKACKLTGYAPDELCARRIQDLVVVDEAAQHRDEAAILRGVVSRSERELIRRDGVHRVVESSARRLDDGRGQVIARDVTERRASERALERLRLAFDQASEGIAVFDRNDGLIYVNPAYPKHPSQRFEPGMPVTEVAAHREPALRLQIEDAIREGTALPPQRWIGQDDTVREGTFAAVRSPDGEHVGWVAMVRDITAATRIEDELRRGQKLDAIGRLAGGVAHDFNNLLSVIGGFTDSLRTHLAGDKLALEWLGDITEATERAADLTRQLLAVGRRQLVRHQPVDLNALIDAAMPMLRRVIPTSIELARELDPGAPLALADPGQLHQILLNLAVNARDAMEGGGRITIGTRVRRVEGAEHGLPALRPGDYVELSLADTGVGMDEELRERMFEPFYSTKEMGHGTGLGLATVLGIVEQSGGGIAVRSAPGKGTRMDVLLPRSARQSQPLSFLATAAPPIRLCGCVLVVDDQDPVRAIMARTLRGAGLTVIEAADGVAALACAAASAEPIVLVVTDIAMPHLDGPGLVAKLRESTPSLPALFTSGYARDALGDAAPPNSDFLAKPFRPKDLVARVAALLADPLA